MITDHEDSIYSSWCDRVEATIPRRLKDNILKTTKIFLGKLTDEEKLAWEDRKKTDAAEKKGKSK
eukprot:1331316-Amorphochlora_amoeboformis.AAC.1